MICTGALTCSSRSTSRIRARPDFHLEHACTKRSSIFMAFLMSHVRLGCLRRTFTVCRDLKSCSHGGHAYVGWMLLLEDRLIHKHRGELEPGSINKGPQRLPYACSNCRSPGRMHAVWAPSRAAIVALAADWKVARSSIGGSNRRPAPRLEKGKGGFGSSGSPA